MGSRLPAPRITHSLLLLQHGSGHRKVHQCLDGELRGVPEGAQRRIHPEEGCHGLDPGDDHRRGGGNWTMITKTTVKSIELRFKLGEAFDETTTDGRNCKTTVTLEGNKMTTSQKATKAGDKDVVAVREFSDDGLTVTMTCEGVSSVQKYKRD